jgi:hypothetical protein
MRRPPRRLLAAVLLVAASACARDRGPRDLESLDEFRTVFNQDRGKLRLVLLLSPT